MRYITPLFLIASCATSTALCMDTEQKEMDLRWQFAKISHLQNTAPQNLYLHGVPKEITTLENKSTLQQALLSVLKAVSLKESFGSAQPNVHIDINMLKPLVAVVEQLEKEETALRIEKKHRATITLLLEFNGIQSGFAYCNKHDLPTQDYLPAICQAIGENKNSN